MDIPPALVNASDGTSEAASCSSSDGLGSSRRGKRRSVASQITFADLFGSTEETDVLDDDSTEPDVDVVSKCMSHLECKSFSFMGYFRVSGSVYLIFEALLSRSSVGFHFRAIP